MDRSLVLRSIVGSHNYNLNTPDSDLDYKYFVLPTFDDLYHRREYSDSKVGDTFDYSTHDIRKLAYLWWKANVNFIEVLFSVAPEYNSIRFPEMADIYARREEIASMNLPYLYDACLGMYYNKMKYIHQGTSGTKHLVDTFGYDTKQALHAYRILDFLCRYQGYQGDGFKRFRDALWYTGDQKRLMLSIKYGAFNYEDFEQMVEDKMESVREPEIRDAYKSAKPNEQLKEWLENKVYDIIKREILLEAAG